jgi:hypothetical protein
MVEQPHCYEVVCLDEGAFGSINVTEIANMKISTTTFLLDFTFHVRIQGPVDVTDWCYDNFAHLC